MALPLIQQILPLWRRLVLWASAVKSRTSYLLFTRASDDLIWSHSSDGTLVSCPEARAYIPNNPAACARGQLQDGKLGA